MNLYDETKNIMKKYNISANKKLGQNFLIDDAVIDNIVEAAKLSKEDAVIEIGPGLGTLTNRLIEKAGKVICVELDERMIKILNDRFGSCEKFELINNDVLKIDLQSIIERVKQISGVKNVKIVANLPYYITTPIIMKLLEEKLDIESITVMVQKEVAERLTAIPGDKLSGAITYTVYYYAEAERVLNVGNNCFIPAPEVESAVIKLNIRKEKLNDIGDEEKFFKIVKLAFMQRRKTFVNALTNGGKIDKNNVLKVLDELGINEKIRGEALTFEQFSEISKKVIM